MFSASGPAPSENTSTGKVVSETLAPDDELEELDDLPDELLDELELEELELEELDDLPDELLDELELEELELEELDDFPDELLDELELEELDELELDELLAELLALEEELPLDDLALSTEPLPQAVRVVASTTMEPNCVNDLPQRIRQTEANQFVRAKTTILLILKWPPQSRQI